jgi:hypothetical protein
VTLGLPLVRTSPDHGTAFDIAGSRAGRCRQPGGRAHARMAQKKSALSAEGGRLRLVDSAARVIAYFLRLSRISRNSNTMSRAVLQAPALLRALHV